MEKPDITKAIVISTSRDGYSPDQCHTITVGEMIELLSMVDPNLPIYTGHDYRDGSWYTYGGIDTWDFVEISYDEDGYVTED